MRARELEQRANGAYRPPPMERTIAELSLVARDLADHHGEVNSQAARLVTALVAALRVESPDAKALGAAARQLEKAAGRPRSRGKAGFAEGLNRLVRVVEGELKAPAFAAADLASIVCDLALTDPSIRKIVPFEGSLAERKHRALRAIKEAVGNSRHPSAEDIVCRIASEAGFARPSRLFAAEAKRSKRGR